MSLSVIALKTTALERESLIQHDRRKEVILVTHQRFHMDVSKNRGGPPKWMVKIMVPNPIKMG